ncbi:MAG: hypothetical protein JRI96_12075 [Deltaproteobacteria bacterium]|nr:hypothetical protein [Deltaproteobacteria bacterium]
MAVENMVDKFHSEFITRTKMDSKGLTLRFSPGYCDWSIEDQKKLFNVFHSNHLEVQLRDSCFMSPRKSISGIFGIGPFHLDFSEHNPCLECSRVDCTMRRT